MSAIKLVAGDTLPLVQLALLNADGSIMNVSGATVNLKFRLAGSSPILATLVCAQPNGGADGIVQFNFPGTTLAVPAGNYEGEITIHFGADIQTIFTTIPFIIRDHF